MSAVAVEIYHMSQENGVFCSLKKEFPQVLNEMDLFLVVHPAVHCTLFSTYTMLLCIEVPWHLLGITCGDAVSFFFWDSLC